MPETSDSLGHSYVIDVANGPEMARLFHQSQLFTAAMGGLFPPDLNLSGVTRLLDIGCGPGEWALSVAHAFPKLAVVGIDVAPGMVRYGRACAWSQGLDNAHFEVSDATQPLPYAQGAFDLIHARFIVGFLDQGSWPPLLAECFRVLTAGGRLLLREAEMGISSSPALQQMSRFLAQAFYEQGRSFAPDRYSLGITHMLGKLLKQAGLVQVQHRPFLLDACAESELYYSTFREMEMVFALLKPYLLASGVVEEEAFEECYRQMLLEMVAEDFTCLSYGVQVWGAKPAQEVPDRSL